MKTAEAKKQPPTDESAKASPGEPRPTELTPEHLPPAPAAPTKSSRALRLGLLAVAALVVVGGVLAVASGARARRGPSNVLTLYGNVDIRQVELGFRVAGRLKSMQFEEGQAVGAGAVMAALDARTFEDELRAAEAEASAQDANVAKLVAGSRPAELARGRAAVDEAVAAEQNARAALKRAEQLFTTQAISRSAYDDAVAAARAAAARVASAKESLRLLVEGSRREDIAAGRATLAVSQARAASAKTALDDTRLVAPSDGVVISRVREPGAIVSPNDVVYVLSLTKPVWVRAYVSEAQLGKLHPGMEVAVSSDAAPQRKLKGHIGFISPIAEFTPKSVETPDLRTDLVYRMRIIVDEPDPGLRQGMPVTVQISTGGA